ncbi:hypothetical protein [Neobacillus mesonae]|uniref:YqgU-like beta propeller domain-containing protein n=1 Tax=Neobacillus mesonae TaxID=1193713 RepID=UPI00203D4445|nr:hypothetical protein [Neobacillus mesonae]MCM3566634.1 hypothetical protein [Neobacillus mesonae]
MVHSSPSTYEGIVTIIDTKGNQKLKESIPSHDLTFEWNPFDESKVMILKFTEDWNFKAMQLDLKKARLTECSLPQPFLKWLSLNEIAYLNWDEDHPSLKAPLVKRDLDTGKGTILYEDITQFAAFRKMLIIITAEGQSSSKAKYTFYGQNRKNLFTFSIPQLSSYSDWLVPFYDYNESNGSFITFQPISSGEADAYSEGFDLVEYNVIKKQKQLIAEGLENEPISFSPSGDVILYGNSLEKIMDLHEKKTYDAVKD